MDFGNIGNLALMAVVVGVIFYVYILWKTFFSKEGKETANEYFQKREEQEKKDWAYLKGLWKEGVEKGRARREARQKMKNREMKKWGA
jgi:hypothetical protein